MAALPMVEESDGESVKSSAAQARGREGEGE